MKATKKLIGASVALVAALAVSVGSTFAWFTNKSTVSVTGVTANVTSGDSNLEVMQVDEKGAPLADDAVFAYTLDLSDVEVKGTALEALTSKDKGATLLNRTEAAKSSEEQAATEGYIEFFLRFRSNDALQVKLAADSAVDSSGTPLGGIKAWDDFGDKYGSTITSGADLATKAAYASRVAFFNPTDDSGDHSENMTLGASKGVWCPNEAEASGKAATTNTTGKGAGFWKGNLASDYEQHLGIDGASAYTATEYETPIAIDSVVLTLAKGSDNYCYGYLGVRVWIEGTDGDCFNYILGDNINVTLNFKGEKTA